MTNYSQDSNRLVNPAKLADDAVLALSSIERGGEVSPEPLKEGIELCDYLIGLLEALKSSGEQKGRLTFRAVLDDMRALQKSKIDIDKVREVKDWINDLTKDASSHTLEEIENIQELLITGTMWMWQNRTLEFREQKLKRGLIIRG